MIGDKDLNQQKYNPSLKRFNFPRPGGEKNLPLPSLEDVRDSEKKEFFSVPEKKAIVSLDTDCF